MKKRTSKTTHLGKRARQIPGKMILAVLFSFLVHLTSLGNLRSEDIRTGMDNQVQPPQTRQITGRVVDTEGEPIPFVTVMVKGTSIGTVADIEGNFILEVPRDANTLVFSYVGMETQEITITDITTVDIVLDYASIGVEGVVVVGYGVQERRTVTGAIASIRSEDIVSAPASNISNAITGQLPGLVSVQRSGEPGRDGATLKIRGIGTLRDGAESNPLILVDGVERANIDLLDPHEIESISILKDASATAVFGVRGANGVIMITTKSGVVGKPQISLTSNMGFQSYTMFPEFVNSYEWATLRNEGFLNEVGPGAQLPFPDYALEAFKNQTNPILYPNVDWVERLLKPYSFQHQYNANISGGTEAGTYFVSLGMMNQDGLYHDYDLVGKDFSINPNYKRYNMRANFDYNISRNLNAKVKMGTILTDANYPRTSTTLIFDLLLRSNPMGLGIIDDKLIGGYRDHPVTAVGGANGIAELIQNGYQKNTSNTYNMNLELKYDLGDFLQGLSVRGMGAYDNFYNHIVGYPKSIPVFNIVVDDTKDDGYYLIQAGDESSFGFTESYSSRYRSMYWESSINYANRFGNHAVTGLILYSQKKNNNPSFQFGIPMGYMGVVGRVTYNYAARYMAEFNMGYNGSENFAEDRRFGFFPAFSAGWVLTEEPFFPHNDILTYLKIRGSYGEVGNDRIGGDRFLYLPSVYNLNAPGYEFGLRGITQQSYSGVIEGKIGNPYVTWERAKKSNIGFEASLMRSRLTFVGDYFIENRDNILWNFGTIPGVIGANLPAANLGKVNNRGFEVETGWRSKIGNVNYSLKGTFSFARNEIVYMDEPTMEWKYLMSTGFSVGQYKAYRTDGFINTQTDLENRPAMGWGGVFWDRGELKFIDVNGDGVVDAFDMVPTGYGSFPEINYGFTMGLEWKGFSLNALLQGASNVTLVMHQSAVNPQHWGTRSAQNWHMGRWTEERYLAGETMTYTRMLVDNNSSPSFQNGQVDFWHQDASYLRLRNLEVGYRYSSNYLKNLGISGIRFYANGRNLLTITDVKNFDPEAPAGAGHYHPQVKVYNFGFNVQF